MFGRDSVTLTIAQEERLVEAFELIVDAESEPVLTPSHRTSIWRRPMVVPVLAFLAVLAVFLPFRLAGNGNGGEPTNSAPTGEQPAVVGETAQPSETTLGEPTVVWPPATPIVEGQTEAAWHCPEVDVQPDGQLDPGQVPDDLRYVPAGDEPVDSAWGVNHGPGCARVPALVAVAFANEQQTAVSAVVVIWVEQPTSRQLSAEGSASRPRDTISAAGGFTVRHSTARGLDEVEAVGVIDGLPVWVESSGVAPDRLLELTAAMSASFETGRVQLTDTSNEFVVVGSNSVDAKVIDHITWYVEGPGMGQSLEVTTLPESNLYQRVVGFFPSLQLIEVAGTTGVLGGEEGGTQRLTWEIEPGIEATVIGEGSSLVRVAESLAKVDANDPRLPTD